MQDYYFIDAQGHKMKVADMPTIAILEILFEGRVNITCKDDLPNATEEDVLERLKIELVIRGS